MTRMRVSLVTLGAPDQQTGGYLYHRRLAEAAPAHDAAMRFVSFPQWPFPLAAVAGAGLMRRATDADVVVIDSIALAFAAPWLRGLQRPVAAMLHQGPGGIDHGRLRARLQAVLDRRAYAHVDVLLVASEGLRDELQGLHRHIRVVAPGRDVAASPDTGAMDLRRGRAIAFLCVGNWIPRKGIIELLDAFALLPESAATLHLVGDEQANPRYAVGVRRRVKALGERVAVHGAISKERVAELYRAADAFVLPSIKEPYGTVYGEAMTAGLPVVGWRAGNLPYLARHECEGLMAEPGDITALAGALHRLVDDAGLRKNLGDAAAIRAEIFPTWDETAALFFSALRDVLRVERTQER